jgi:hypothetical protein
MAKNRHILKLALVLGKNRQTINCYQSFESETGKNGDQGETF